MNRLLRYIFVIFAVLAAGACARPVGDIGGEVGFDSLLSIPFRTMYDINDLFSRYSDLSVLASFRGELRPISVTDVDISVVEDPDWNPDVKIPVPADADYALKTKGRKLIVIKYDNLSTQYSIDVRDPYGLGENENNNGGDDGSGITIIWPE